MDINLWGSIGPPGVVWTLHLIPDVEHFLKTSYPIKTLFIPLRETETQDEVREENPAVCNLDSKWKLCSQPLIVLHHSSLLSCHSSVCTLSFGQESPLLSRRQLPAVGGPLCWNGLLMYFLNAFLLLPIKLTLMSCWHSGQSSHTNPPWVAHLPSSIISR